MSRLPDPVERVASYIRDAGAEARIEEFGEETSSAEDAARALGCDLHRIVKTLVFDCEGRAVVAMVPGDRRADRAKIAAAAGCARARIVPAEEVERLTGFSPGAVAPFPLPQPTTAILDHSLLAHDLVWIGAGSHKHLAGIRPLDLLRLARAQSVDIAEDG